MGPRLRGDDKWKCLDNTLRHRPLGDERLKGCELASSKQSLLGSFSH
jgi:hypothetical protein